MQWPQLTGCSLHETGYLRHHACVPIYTMYQTNRLSHHRHYTKYCVNFVVQNCFKQFSDRRFWGRALLGLTGGDNSLETKRNPVVRLLLFNMWYDDALSFTSTVELYVPTDRQFQV